MHPQVSVIIPVYNAAEYIDRCAKSLFAQSLASIQYIFVDDASTDESISIIQNILAQFPNRHDQVIFLHQDIHKGVGATRQRGLERAEGDYVIHCDSDDWVEPLCYQLLYEKAIATQADIVCCGFFIDSDDGRQLSVQTPLRSFNPPQFNIGSQTGSLWSKLIKRELILEHGLEVSSDIDWGEDLCFSLEALLMAKNVQYVDHILYHYVQQPGSLTHDITFEKINTLMRCGAIVESFLCKHGLLGTYHNQVNWLKFQLKQYYLIFPKTRSLQIWRDTFTECNNNVLSYPAPLYLKISSWLIIHHMAPFARVILRLKDCLFLLKNT